MARDDPFDTDPWAGGADPFQEMLAKQAGQGPDFVPPPHSTAESAPSQATGEQLPPPPPSAALSTSDAAQEYARRAALPKSTVALVVALTLGVIGLIAVWGFVDTFGSDAAPDETYVAPPATLAPADVVGDEPAEVGTSIDASWGAVTVGRDVAPGVYVAPGAADLAPGECWWTLTGRLTGSDAETFIYGQSAGFEPLVVLGDGLTFEAPGCGEWVAINPDSAFQGATAESLGSEVYAYGGRDIVPGTYLSHDPTAKTGACSAQAVDAYAALAGSYGRYGMATQGGTTIIDVREGELVSTYACPTFTRVNLAQVLALDEGETSFPGEGMFIVGIDVVSGTYGAERARAECSITVYPDYLMWESPVADSAQWYGPDELDAVNLAVGESIYVWGCPEFELVGTPAA